MKIFVKLQKKTCMVKIEPEIFDFLKELAINNNREWFSANRDYYNRVRSNFIAFVQEVIDRLAKENKYLKGLEAESCIFRINRDIRFSADKSPYKTNFGALIMRGGRKNIHRFAGNYIHIEPGESMLAGGAYMPPTPWLNAIREKISEEPERFTDIILNKNFKRLFGEIENDKLKNAPKGFSSDHPYIELIKYKSYNVVNYIKDKDVISDDFLDYVVRVMLAMKPFNDFLNECAVMI